jgi:hypothetical protein
MWASRYARREASGLLEDTVLSRTVRRVLLAICLPNTLFRPFRKSQKIQYKASME